MGIGNILSRTILVSKATGLIDKSRYMCKKDVIKFINKRGELNTFTVYKDEFQRPFKKELLNITTGTKWERNYKYCTYTYENGHTVQYKEINTFHFNPTKVPLNTQSKNAEQREIIATVQNGEKLDVTKSSCIFFQPKKNGNIYETSYVARFANGKKPQGTLCRITRTPKMDILSKTTNVQDANGKISRIKTDLFYNSPAYPDALFRRDTVRQLMQEMGVGDSGVTMKAVHRGYSHEPGAVNNFGKYNHKKRLYTYNIDHPKINTRKGFVGNTAHELTHTWQYKEVDLLEQGALSGARKDAAEIYKKEFDNYIHSSATDNAQYKAYKEQQVETRARAMDSFVSSYYTRNIKNIYNCYVKGIIPPQVGITHPIPVDKITKL